MKRLALALCVIAAGCRERELPLDAGHLEVGHAHDLLPRAHAGLR